MIATEQEILKALSFVEDPDLKKDLVTLNMIQKITSENNQVSFDLVLTTPACPMKDMIANACKNAIATMVSDKIDVRINITSSVQESLKERAFFKGVKNIIAVASGKGGVGKSTVAINIAKNLRDSGAAVGLLDADIHGPSIPVLLNMQGKQPELQDQKMLPLEHDGIKVMSIGFLVSKEQALVWRGPMLSKAINQFCADVIWGELDYLIVDLPPGTGDIHLSILQQIPLSGVVIVTTPEEVAVADARKAIDMFLNPHLKQRILGIVENMSYFNPPETDKKYYLFGKEGGAELAKEFDIDLLGQIPIVENKTSDDLQAFYLPVVGKLAQKLAVLAAS